MRRLILASASEVRARVLKGAGVDFEVRPAHVDEEAVKDSLLAAKAPLRDVADALAELKAVRVSASVPDAFVLGADQVLAFEGELVSKCIGLDEARTLLRTYADLGGIYNIGAGNRGIAQALEESGRARQVVFIGHELTEYTRRFLLSGIMDAVIDQNPRVEAREAVDRLIRAARNDNSQRAVPVRIQAIFRENIPEI